MDQEAKICYCFHVSRRKLENFVRREKPKGPSQLSESGGAGTGCGGSPRPPEDQSRAAVEASLGAWSKGGTPNQSGIKGVEMNDPDWKAGYELASFQVTKAEGEKDNRQVHARLDLQDAKGKAV